MALTDNNWYLNYGAPFPFGATWNPVTKGFNFALYSKEATRVTLVLFQMSQPDSVVFQMDLDPFVNKIGPVWHCYIAEEKLNGADCYAYRVDGNANPGNAFNFKKLLIDPWAKAVFFPPNFSRAASKDDSDNIGKAPLGQLLKAVPGNLDTSSARLKHFSDLIIYEVHVKGFTMHNSSAVQDTHKGTFSGVIDKIPYLTDLGVTAVELMPVHQFDVQENNYWGYMTLNFFAPHNLYCTSKVAADQIAEFKTMVQALHDAGIEVILDVIYNHTSEGGKDDTFFSYKGIDNSTYYLLTPDLRSYINDAGTGNVMRTSNRIVRKLVLDSLRYWAVEMNVDGFRFDLATIFTRNDDGTVNLVNPPILEEISMDPVLSRLRLIAEPWDIKAYQLGAWFPATDWSQWNGAYRDDIRKFVKGDEGLIGTVMKRLYGSDDLFPDSMPYSCHPFQTINFVTAHDGFTLYDLVSYNEKHNSANGNNNTDGSNDNFSWNCGIEGDQNLTDDVLALRKKQVKNFITLLMISNGVPMFRMGDEFMQTQSGNNNAYNQDNETSWLNWNRKQSFPDIYRFFKMIIKFRKDHPAFLRINYWRDDITWFGTGKDVDFSFTSHTISLYIKGSRFNDADFYIMINAYFQPLPFDIQIGNPEQWKRVIDTNLQDDTDIVDTATASSLTSLRYTVAGRSVVVFERTA